MQLFHAGASPFVRKVMVLLHETGQLDDVAIVGTTVSPVTGAETVAVHNPLGKLPTLTRPDGPALYDSRVICRYLDQRAGGRLYPANRLWDVLTVEATADGIMDAAVLLTYENRLRDAPMRLQGWIDGQWQKIDRALDAVGEIWLSNLCGPFDMGQIAMGCALEYLDFRHDDHAWRAGRSALADWQAAFAARPSMAATRPAG